MTDGFEKLRTVSGVMAGTGIPDNVVDIPFSKTRPIEIVQTSTGIRNFILVASQRAQTPFAKIQSEGSTFVRVAGTAPTASVPNGPQGTEHNRLGRGW